MFARDMHGRIIRFLLTGLVLVLGLFPSGATASSYDYIVAFGDSLSQTKLGPIGGRWITGQVWVEYLSSSLGVELTNTAVGANTTSNLLSQAQSYDEIYGEISHNALVTVWAGGADLPYLMGKGKEGTTYETAAGNLNDAIIALIGNGARNFVILNLPNIGVVPDVISTYKDDLPQDFLYKAGFADDAAVEYASWWSQGFNGELDGYLNRLKAAHSDCEFYTYDTYAMLTDMVLVNPDKYEFDIFFTDDFHLSTGVHAYIADQVYAQVVPLPASLLFLGSGLLGLIGVRRVRKG